MVVKKETNSIEKLREILKDQNGILFTSDLANYGIPRTYLSILIKNGEIQRISRGSYIAVNYMVDEMSGIQARYKGAIFSHETALYLLDLTDRTPLFYSVTVPARYNATLLKASGAKVFFVKRDLYQLGRITMQSSHGNDISTYDLERTICDLIRSRTRIDVQILNDVLKRFVKLKSEDYSTLMYYAKKLKVETVLKNYLEALPRAEGIFTF